MFSEIHTADLYDFKTLLKGIVDLCSTHRTMTFMELDESITIDLEKARSYNYDETVTCICHRCV